MSDKKFRIKKVKTIIVEKKQRVLLKLEGVNLPVDIPFNGISYLFPDADIRKIEFLIDSFFIIRNDEVQLNEAGKVNDKWSIELNGNLSDCVQKNISYYREFQKINHIITAQIDNHIPSFLIEGYECKRFIPISLFLSLTGLDFADYKLILGSYMTYETWVEGDWAIDYDAFDETNDDGYRRKIKRSGMILKHPIFRTPGDLDSVSSNHKIILWGNERKKQTFIHRKPKNDH